MNSSGRLLVASVLAVVLMAPPAYPQGTNERIQTLNTDVLNLASAFKEMRDNQIAKNNEMKALLEQILGRFTTIDTSVQKLESSLSTLKANDERSTQDLRDAKTALTEIKKVVDGLTNLKLGETLGELKVQVGGLTRQITTLQTTEAPLPDAREAFLLAESDYNGGFYDVAIGGFRDFISSYPKDIRTPKAQLMIGNSYAALGRFMDSDIEYDKTIQTYPESDTKCTALYKKGLTLALRKPALPTQAAAAFDRVSKECPNSIEAPLAAAERKKLPR